MNLTFVVLDQVFDSGLTAMLDIFSMANELGANVPGTGAPLFNCRLAGMGGMVTTGLGLQVNVVSFAEIAACDWLIVPALAAKTPPVLERALTRADVRAACHYIKHYHARGAHIAAACTGTFLVAETGLLDGGEATTTWSLAPFFRQRYAGVRLDETRLVKWSNGIATAGAMMGHMDLALWLVRQHSPELAARLARFMLIDARASQAEYIIPDFLAHADPLIERFEAWCRDNLHRGFDLQAAASFLHVHSRTLQRRSEAVLGKSPLAFFQDLRIEQARKLLRQGFGLDRVAEQVGYSDATVLGALLKRKLGYGVQAIRAGQLPGSFAAE